MKARIKSFFEMKQEGIGVIEIILILVIIIGLILIFKDQITEIINEAFLTITQDASTITN